MPLEENLGSGELLSNDTVTLQAHRNFTTQKAVPERTAPPLKARATYSGVSRATRMRKQAENRAAAAGCARADSFFRTRVLSPPPTDVNVLGSEFETIITSDSNVNIEGTQAESLPVVSESTVTRSATDIEAPDVEVPASEFLDPASDKAEEDGSVEDNVYRCLDNLIRLAKKHKSATALFKLHTLKMCLELYAKMKINPHIKNPAQ